MYMDLPLTTENYRHLFFNKDKLLEIKDELISFCEDIEFLRSKDFPKEVLFPHELKNNNAIEGYYEDISSIIKIINNPCLKHYAPDKEYRRILNLYNGYEFILQGNEINETNLYSLYQILSNNLLEKQELIKPNRLYRDNDGFIFFSDNILIEPDKGFDEKNIDFHMKELFSYINMNNDNLDEVDLFFKSQIIHFYMVFIHPYFDINGRTSRTTSLWFLNNHKAFPYTIFNRAITYDKKDYYRIIREVKRFKNITPFINFVANGTKRELEKEYIIKNLEKNSGVKLSALDKQMLQYILMNNSQNTIIDIQNIYNRYNPKVKFNFINSELLQPLFDYGILLKKDNTSRQIYSGEYNYRFGLNQDMLDVDEAKIKRLDIKKFI